MSCCRLNPNKKASRDLLYILTVYFNPAKSPIRAKLYTDFRRRLEGIKEVVLVTIECAFNETAFEMTSPNNDPFEIRIRSNSLLWIKENLINIALLRLSRHQDFQRECKYVAWADADIEFMDVDWVEKVKKSLESYTIVQMFKYCLFLDQHQGVLETHTSFGFYYATRQLQLQKGEYPHPGYAWCTTKDRLLKVGGLYDRAILGSGDTHMAFGVVGDSEKGFLKGFEYAKGFRNSVKKWEKTAVRAFKKKLGFVDMNIRHFWHGKRENRRQIYRWQLLQDFSFDPVKDLVRKKDGHYEISKEKKELEKQLYGILIGMKEEEEELEIPDELDAASILLPTVENKLQNHDFLKKLTASKKG